MMNHFEAAQKMREIAEKKLGPKFEGKTEIDWQGTMCSGGLNVEGQFRNADKELSLFWDAAFQRMEEAANETE